MTGREVVLDDVRAERARQDAKWGPVADYTAMPDGTGPDVAGAGAGYAGSVSRHVTMAELAAAARRDCDRAHAEGRLTWRHILTEEAFEALAESDVDRLRAELVQVAAVAARWVETIDARRAATLAPAD